MISIFLFYPLYCKFIIPFTWHNEFVLNNITLLLTYNTMI